jgi:tRNA uridine 5-carboxymethylaminomethyl modification enzyme
MLRKHTNVRDRWQQQFKYVMIDEYQDTNTAQYKLVKLLTGPHNNIAVVGDDWQSIYSWRGADFKNILKFEKVQHYIQENNLDKEIIEQAEIQVKYSGYIEKERNNAEKLIRLEDIKIPENFDYYKIKSMSIEAKQKLSAIRPVTISQASRISGVSPSDVSVLLIYMGR